MEFAIAMAEGFSMKYKGYKNMDDEEKKEFDKEKARHKAESK